MDENSKIEYLLVDEWRNLAKFTTIKNLNQQKYKKTNNLAAMRFEQANIFFPSTMN